MKKGYFFLVDVFFAIFILSAGYLIITSKGVSHQNEIPLSVPLENSVEFLSSVRFDEMCGNNCTCPNSLVKKFCINNRTSNKNQTLVSIIGELYKKGDKINISNLFYNLTFGSNMMNKETTGAELLINGETIYSSSNAENEKNLAREILSTKRIIVGYYDIKETGAVIFWGPYIFQVDAWQK